METMVKYIAMKTLENQHKEENENDPESHPSGLLPGSKHYPGRGWLLYCKFQLWVVAGSENLPFKRPETLWAASISAEQIESAEYDMIHHKRF